MEQTGAVVKPRTLKGAHARKVAFLFFSELNSKFSHPPHLR